jgi:type II secretory pathway component PulJ
MRRFVIPARRGLTFLEFILSLAITAMVALAITGMLTSVAMGQRLRRDNRAFVIRTHALKSRLAEQRDRPGPVAQRLARG